jgi:ubiquinone/menaquinone biosynthesis C-methylase UbiE
MTERTAFIPALRFRFLTPLYDPLLRRGMGESRFKRRLVEEARIRPGDRVLDLGSGTGTLTVLLKEMHPGARVVGLDADPQVLEIARAKAAQKGVQIQFDEGLAYQLPYPDAAFDRVLSSLMIHHLGTAEKRLAFGEAFRVLRLGGELLVLDFGIPHGLLASAISVVMRRLERTGDNFDGRLPGLIQSAGFQAVQIATSFNTIFGTLALYRARK